MQGITAAGNGASIWRGAAWLLALGLPALAQAQDDGLTPQQRQGRQLFGQACVVCHLPPVRNAATYGPPLHRASAAGNEDLMRGFITNGSARMPAFKYHLNGSEIDALVAYLRTLPVPAANKGDAQ